MGWIVAGIFALVGLANQGLALWDKLFPKKSPPDSERYANKTELQALAQTQKQELETLRAAQSQELERIQDELNTDMTRIEHRFESWLSAAEKLQAAKDSSLERWRGDLAEWQRTIERALGRIEEATRNPNKR